MNCNFIEFNEGDSLVKVIELKKEKKLAYMLRHEIFCCELKWVNKEDDGQRSRCLRQ